MMTAHHHLQEHQESDTLLHFNDPYEAVFNNIAEKPTSASLQIAGGHGLIPRITSEAQWHHFLDGLHEAGLLSNYEADKDVINDIWTQIMKEAAYFQPKDKPRINLTFETWKKMLCDRLARPEVVEMERQIHQMNHQMAMYEQKISRWDPSDVTTEEAERLLSSVVTMLDKRGKVQDAIEDVYEADAYAVRLEASWRVICGEQSPIMKKDKNGRTDLSLQIHHRAPQALNNPDAWQADQLEQMERMCRARRPRKIRFLATRKSGPRGCPVEEDVYGVAQGYNHLQGIQVYHATCETKESDGEREALVVVVPTSAPFHIGARILRGWMAARELSLSSGSLLHALGKDWNAKDEALYYYESVPSGKHWNAKDDALYYHGSVPSGITLKQLLRPHRRRRIILDESGRLFRYWAGLIAKALAQVQEQCTHAIENTSIGLDNIVVCGKGLKLRLGGLRFLDQINSFHGEREFGLQRQEMLGLNRHSCWAPGWYENIGQVVDKGELHRVSHFRALASGLLLHEGDEVVVELDAHHRVYHGFRIRDEDPVTSAFAGNKPCIKLTQEDLLSYPSPDQYKDLLKIHVRGLRPGSCTILCDFDDYEAPPPSTTNASTISPSAASPSSSSKANIRSRGGRGGEATTTSNGHIETEDEKEEEEDEGEEGHKQQATVSSMRQRHQPLEITVEVLPNQISPPLQAILRFCQLASHSAPRFTGKTKVNLERPVWMDRISKLWIQDLASNPYFTEAVGEGDDIDLEQIMCEYETLFEGRKEEEEGESLTPREGGKHQHYDD